MDGRSECLSKTVEPKLVVLTPISICLACLGLTPVSRWKGLRPSRPVHDMTQVGSRSHLDAYPLIVVRSSNVPSLLPIYLQPDSIFSRFYGFSMLS